MKEKMGGEHAWLITLYELLYISIYVVYGRFPPPHHGFGPITLESRMGNKLCFLPEITIICIIIIQGVAIIYT